MVQTNEVISLFMGIGVLIFIIINRSLLRRLPVGNLLFTAFLAILSGWLLTLLEGFFWPVVLNLLEHSSYTLGSILTAVWCWQVFGGREKKS